MTGTRTYALLLVNQSTYDDIQRRLEKADSLSTLKLQGGTKEVIDLDGIAIGVDTELVSECCAAEVRDRLCAMCRQECRVAAANIVLDGPPYFEDHQVCGYCQRKPGEKHQVWCRQ